MPSGATIASLVGFIALRYAIRANLTQPELNASAVQVARVDLSNPLTAAIACALFWKRLNDSDVELVHQAIWNSWSPPRMQA